MRQEESFSFSFQEINLIINPIGESRYRLDNFPKDLTPILSDPTDSKTELSFVRKSSNSVIISNSKTQTDKS
ncbi:hypothetical protein LEP1GSC071_2670 [Leptospira santarosai str. JET]|nr:hypothetical protein LEP1GSC071_2670 [Leptospira santarosai str. JET]